MRKHLASRIIGLAVLYCAVFCVLVIAQFSNSGNFSLSAGEMTIRGRYYQTSAPEESSETNTQLLAGGVRVFFGGLEFNLKEERSGGLILTGNDSAVFSANPEFMIISENTMRLGLPGGTILVFNSLNSARGPELNVTAEFADNVSEVTVPITLRRASLIRDNGRPGILYNGDRYFFGGSGQELDNGNLVLSKENTFASYRSIGQQEVFNPADYIIAQAQDYEYTVTNWRDLSFAHWEQNAGMLQNEDDITAYCSEALRQGNFTTAVASIPRDFLNSARHTYKSSGFIGGMAEAHRTFTIAESEQINLITRLTRERSPDIFKEEHLIDYLFNRGNNALASDVIELINDLSPDQIIADYSPGLLEAYSDIRRWRPALDNPVEPLTEKILMLVSENLSRDTERDLVFASNTGSVDLEYSIRLGKALIYWADSINNTEWIEIGRSLVISALTSGGIGAGNLHCILNPGDYYPRAAWLADNGLWAWTVSPSVRASYTEGNLNITASFPVNMTHHLIIRGVRPFLRLQIHGQDWRTDSQFESYDSSGWVYYPQDQILVMKLRHRLTVENIRIFYVAPPPVMIEEGSADTEEDGVNS